MIRKGDQWVAHVDRRPAERLFIEVTRVARDQSWADITVRTWAVQWRKRQTITNGLLPMAEPRRWGLVDLGLQEKDWELKRLEERLAEAEAELDSAMGDEAR